MTIEVAPYDDPNAVLDVAEPFLAAEPVLNNLLLTVLAERILHPEPGRYWIASEHHHVVGIALHTPLFRPVALCTMSEDAAAAMGRAIAAERHAVPGVSGEARVTARFAAEWAEHRKIGAIPVNGQRIYEARVIREGLAVPGTVVCAAPAHFELVRDWACAFNTEIGEPTDSAAQFAEHAIEARESWLWSDGGPRSIATARSPAHGVARIRLVYTPAEHRRRGYAETLVRTLTRRLLTEGVRPILYADLANPTSNGVYRRIGYERVAEIIRYRFAIAGEVSPVKARTDESDA